MKFFIVITLLFASTMTAISTIAEDNVAVSPSFPATIAAYLEQHSRLLDALLYCDREDVRIFKERKRLQDKGRAANLQSSLARLTGTARRDRFGEYQAEKAVDKNQADHEFLDQQKRDNERKRQDLEIEKGKLKSQVIKADGILPLWWSANEERYTEDRKAVISQAIK